MQRLLLLLLLIPFAGNAQQDCTSAIPLCQPLSFQGAFVGTGNLPQEINSSNSCLGGGEVNSVWFETTIVASGNFNFTIFPNNTVDDYDWAVYDLTTSSCADIFSNPALEISCNFSGNSGNTGPNGNAGAQNEPAIPVTAGTNLLIVVSNWSGSANGFTIDPTASTATLGCDSSCFDSLYNVSVTAINDFTCGNPCDGSAYVTINGGSPPYSIQWSDPAQTTNDTISNLCGGDYHVIITDSLGCVRTGSVQITTTSLSLFSFNSTPADCGQCNGSIQSAVNGGVPPYSYSWSPAGTGPNPTNLCPGVYTLVVTDSVGCSITGTVTLNSTFIDTVAISNTPTTCTGICDGTASVNLVCSNPPCTVDWLDDTYTSIGQSGNTATGLCPGTYFALVQDALGCSTYVGTVLQDGSLSATISVNPASCNCLGSITVNPIGGAGGYEYSFDGGATWVTTNVLGNLCGGIYPVLVRDSLGCESDTVQSFISSTPFSISILNATDSLSCQGLCNGLITTTQTGGALPISYVWSNNGVSAQQYNLCAGTYSVIAQDANGCIDSSLSWTISEPPLLVIDTVMVTTGNCIVPCSGTAQVTGSGGSPPYTYNISGGSPQSSTLFTNLCNGSYTITIIDDHGCISQPNTITINDGSPQVTVSSDTTICQGTCVQLNASGASSFVWVPATGLDNPNIYNPIACPTSDITYCVVGTDSIGCISDTMCTSITVVDTFAFGTSGDPTITLGGWAFICANPISNNLTYLWSTGDTTACITVSPTDTTVYYVTIYDPCGNVHNDSVTVYVVDPNSVNEFAEAKFDFNLFPNPMNNELFLEFTLDRKRKVDITIYDLSGKAIVVVPKGELQKGNHRLQVHQKIPRLASGSYVLRMHIDDELIVQRFEVIH